MNELTQETAPSDQAGFPPGLRRRFAAPRLLAEGGEARVYLVRRAGDGPGGQPVVVKVDKRAPVQADRLVLLARPDATRHVPKIHGYGNVTVDGRSVGWVEQEYCPHGSLRSLLTGPGRPAGDGELRRIVAALAECLDFWVNDLGLAHSDVKPANILVRSRDPYRLLIGDFGGTARDVPGIAAREDLLLTPAYAAPESVRGDHGGPAAWWALGVIAYEMLLHRTPYGALPVDGIRAMLRAGERPSLTDVRDRAWRTLIEGLLTVGKESRWGYDDVVAWATGSPPRPRFQGRSHRTVEDLVDDLDRNWRAGAAWLAGNGAAVADRMVRDGAEPASVAYLRGVPPDRAPAVLARLTARVIPQTMPHYRGRAMDETGLLALARGGPDDQRLLREAVRAGVVEHAARHRCAHPGCGDGCAVLARVAARVPAVVRRARDRLGWSRHPVVNGYRGDPPVELPSARERTLLWAWATEAELVPEAAERMRALVAAVPLGAQWWAEVRAAAVSAGADRRGDLVAARLLARHALVIADQ
ncbi:serine/threonine protein kinase [Actinomadura flavalba]|uniref:serine/threonine protein kinase n=1 Tax=Actinomadura flavalba TaxID=1120938 RepID=UPI000367711A|nr:protein kinase [Actinomadura flavalba]